MSYKTETAEDLQAVVEKMLAPQLDTFNTKIRELRFEINRSQRETIELRGELRVAREECRVLGVRLKDAIKRLTLAGDFILPEPGGVDIILVEEDTLDSDGIKVEEAP